SERRRWKHLSVVQIRALRIVRPRETDGDRIPHRIAPDADAIADDRCARPDERSVAAGNLEPADFVARGARPQAPARVREHDDDRVPNGATRAIGGAGGDDRFAV